MNPAVALRKYNFIPVLWSIREIFARELRMLRRSTRRGYNRQVHTLW